MYFIMFKLSYFFSIFRHSFSMCQLNVKEDTWPKFDFTILAQLDHFHMLEQPTPFLDVLVVLLVDCCWLDLIVSNRLEPRETEPVDQMETNCVSSFARNRKCFSQNVKPFLSRNWSKISLCCRQIIYDT